ncbi:hypothetical protein CEXT_284291 [Caerostris extrusa]|uniref:Uncharacterized protein n=1 Tax=Caerostris extrusa TaxID=172846 RepID=A0AAV4XNW6_CAEEX|nr:hypothetical protein CEXT_284291 [Caerostris extrusa]
MIRTFIGYFINIHKLRETITLSFETKRYTIGEVNKPSLSAPRSFVKACTYTHKSSLSQLGLTTFSTNVPHNFPKKSSSAPRRKNLSAITPSFSRRASAKSASQGKFSISFCLGQKLHKMLRCSPAIALNAVRIRRRFQLENNFFSPQFGTATNDFLKIRKESFYSNSIKKEK